jgi:glucan phosphoethanolaminetransferase (alkaline phosphatase superfamily)
MSKLSQKNITKHDNRIVSAWFLKIFLALLLVLPIPMAAFYYFKIGTALYIVVGTALLSLGFLFIPFVFFKQKTAFLISAVWVLISPLEIIHLVLYQESVGPGFVLLLFQTNFQEMWELIVYHKFPTIVYLITAILYFFITIKFIKNEYLLPKQFRLFALIVLLLFMVALYAFTFKSVYSTKRTTSDIFVDTNDAFVLKFRKIYPTSILVAFDKAYHIYEEIFSINPDIQNFTFQATKKNSIPEREIYIFVIGETARYASFSINGYQRETTPLLSKTNNLISYTDVYTSANLTSISLPLLLSRATPQDFGRAKKEKAITDAFSEAGFLTYWIANQSNDNTFVRSIADRTNQSFFSIKNVDSVNNFDEDLWQYLEKVFSKDEQKQFIVVHTLGSHFRYNLRYPDKFRKFQPDLTGMTDYTLIGKNMKEQLVNSYDNSILYTDYFLANTIKKLDELDAVSYLFYISDHGENLYDDENDYAFHASNYPSEIEVHIPMLVWTSDKYRDTYPAKHDAIVQNVNKKLSADVVFHSLLDMADIVIPDDNFQKSIANLALEDDSIRFVLNPKKEIVVFK